MGDSVKLIHGDCLEILKKGTSESVDSLVTDPPAGIGFMGKEWDHHKGGRDQWVAWMTDVMRECHRVLKPGAHGLVWALPRTSHWTAWALEEAGFEIRDSVHHIFGSGFPKSMDVSKAIDKAAGAERKRVPGGQGGKNTILGARKTGEAISGEAKQWDGWGTALKPAHEVWWLIRKPLGEKTVAKNVLKHGTGALNIDASRVGTHDQINQCASSLGNNKTMDGGKAKKQEPTVNQGRFPSNQIVSGEARDVMDGQSLEGGMHSADSGGASRFFYCAKASKRERGDGNNHPTVKAQKLMRYLTRMVTPPGGTVLDPFMGSGSTGVACAREGFKFVGIEAEKEYLEIARARIDAAQSNS